MAEPMLKRSPIRVVQNITGARPQILAIGTQIILPMPLCQVGEKNYQQVEELTS